MNSPIIFSNRDEFARGIFLIVMNWPAKRNHDNVISTEYHNEHDQYQLVYIILINGFFILTKFIIRIEIRRFWVVIDFTLKI